MWFDGIWFDPMESDDIRLEATASDEMQFDPGDPMRSDVSCDGIRWNPMWSNEILINMIESMGSDGIQF